MGIESRRRLIEWHRQKAGTIELVHDVIKNDLGGGVLPSKYFGANAAWLRLAVIAHNVLQALKRLALPAELLTARPKRLRFLLFNMPGRLVHHARRLILRVAAVAEWIEMYREGAIAWLGFRCTTWRADLADDPDKKRNATIPHRHGQFMSKNRVL